MTGSRVAGRLRKGTCLLCTDIEALDQEFNLRIPMDLSLSS